MADETTATQTTTTGQGGDQGQKQQAQDTSKEGTKAGTGSTADAGKQGGDQGQDTSGADKSKSQGVTFSPEQQEFINNLIKKTTKEEREAAEAAAAEKEKVAQGKYQELYENKTKEVENLKPFKTQAETLAKLMNENIASEIKDWPEEVKAMDPGEENVEARIKWLTSARAVAQKLQGTSTEKKAPDTEQGQANKTQRRPGEAAMNAQAGQGEGEGKKQRPFRFQQPGDVSW